MNAKSFKSLLIQQSIKLIKKDIDTNQRYHGTDSDKVYSGDILSMKKGENLVYETFKPEEPNKYFDIQYGFCFNTTDCPFTSFNEKTFKKSKWYFLDPFALIPENKINRLYEGKIKDKDIENAFDKRKIDLIVKLFSD